MSTVNTQTSTQITIRCTIVAQYKRLAVPKAGLPLFISFHPDNIVKFTIQKIYKDKITSLLTMIQVWFEGLNVLKIDEDEECIND